MRAPIGVPNVLKEICPWMAMPSGDTPSIPCSSWPIMLRAAYWIVHPLTIPRPCDTGFPKLSTTVVAMVGGPVLGQTNSA